MSFVTVRDLFQTYGNRPIIERVNVDVAEGEFISIVGASGCGKSTFLRLLLAQERPTRGEIRIDGAEPAREPGLDRGIVFQRYSVFPHMTVRDNIVAGESFRAGWGRFFGDAAKAARDRADQTLARIGLDHVADNYPATLSGGMQQRLAIAQALAAKPRVLLLDEPFGALDPGTRLSMHDFLQDLRAETGMTVFMVTHDLEEAFKLGDRVLVFDKPRWDPHDPSRYGATITYDFDARDGGIPFQTLKENIHVPEPH
ncbi:MULTISPECIES: ABC transporter ATP-binding protein [Marivita]|uniref:ABC transporter ATP-binding protein n=1 Tax=Marivita cryptomonadis TaxID=505252 RepID=A0A9Q2RY67_9RHOB|nr:MULTISPECIES: ABC transporter ATP-binding protein [Marivita]MCR9167458.1 ABC transporter ATP-binding protein [Paracoccaceae bacterium]MBM2322577.1 ABC transporter ATP-binding protein [Marivita cryptomonadis]MBM2332159.1 ABC transporter ATP-binding protein [Marivita cryptomonadis]MBM2341743.1 ABC transporter ATP-binding protein [Marivita cryptomonadis]MBM2346407.1 ABC transporter ATP-binding protein [Marivita cryptomonadis]